MAGMSYDPKTGIYTTIPETAPKQQIVQGVDAKENLYTFNSGAANSTRPPANNVTVTAPTRTTYIGPDGEKHEGYIIGGRTFTDEAGTTPVGVGSIVDTNGGRFIKTPNGSQLYADYLREQGIRETQTLNPETGAYGIGYIQNGKTYTDPLLQNRVGAGTVVNTDGGRYIMTPEGVGMLYSDYLDLQNAKKSGATARLTPEDNTAMEQLQTQLDEVDALLEKAKAANDAAYAQQLEQLRAQISNQISSLNAQYQGINRQLYRDFMLAQRDLPQQLAAQGYTGGLRESSLLGLRSGYEGQLAENERARLAGIRDIEAGQLDRELTLGVENIKAQQEAEEQAYARAATIRAAIIEQQNLIEKYRREDEANERAIAQAQADALLTAGGSVPASIGAAAGYSTDYTDAMAALGGAVAKPRLTAAQVNQAIKNGVLSDQVLDAYEYYYGTPYAAAAAGTTETVKGYDNATLTTEQVKAAQRAAGLTGSSVDGKWGPKTTAAVGMSAAQYAQKSGGGVPSQQALANELKAVLRSGASEDEAYELAFSYIDRGMDESKAQAAMMDALKNW